MSLRHALLGLLSDHPASGYDLLKLFDTSLANVWPATQSQIYTELTKLADAGLITVSTEGPRGRKEYALTDGGLAELRHWLVETPPQRTTRSDVLLRVFFLSVLTPAQGHAYLAGLAAMSAEEHDALRALHDSIDWDDGGLSVHGRIALEYGLRFNTMRREWAEWAAEQIKPG
ncbi:PadR family transcriptional regulator [Solihabitans fulvus]|uniref:PadR family transcriptional regulator n=1 Tax=Solihabitans fulvus TaxID=1892852 RepID=A0A5B2XJ82_9PSEU|nr:PadR family transcriptional regulator [Solihabitans fulvus]KAA2263473.1 PadR family transcriptional regulator [Solihabitans fulvus]